MQLRSDLLARRSWRAALCLLVLAFAGTGAGAAALILTGNTLPTAIAFAVAVGTLVAWVGHRRLVAAQARMGRLRDALHAISQGNLGGRLRLEEMGDLRDEAAAVNGLAQAVAESVQRMRALTLQLQRLPEEIVAALSEIEQGAENQEAAVEETASLLANINTSIGGINTEVDQLARHNEDTASSITQMGTAVEQVARSAVELQNTVEGSTSAVNQMSAQIRRVAENADSVLRVAEETASAIAEMDQTIRQMGDHVQEASALTEKVSESAEAGTRAVGSTIDGIAQIRDMTLDARSALGGLEDRIAQIGEIANVIGGISDETNLLSLNAAIIAAQAGEHGKAFGVVAAQVKTLARRTTASAKEIEQLIQAVQAESTNAVKAMGTGIEAVEEGVDRSRVAGQALEVILISSREASLRVHEIARAAEEQMRNSRHVADAAQQTSEHIQQISNAMNEQTLAADQLLKNSTTAVEMCSQVTRATEEQRETGRYIATNAAAITEMIRSIQQETAAHAATSGSVSSTVNSILDNARKSCERIPEVARNITALQEQAEAVASEIARFQGGAAEQ